jgi:predicted metal-dependent phosphoesterase TrpH
MNDLQYESLHNHTTLSDGKLTHLEFLDVAQKYGFGVIAFTDHDVLPDKKTIDLLYKYDGLVKWLIGAEISSGLPKKLGGGVTSNFHIVGLFIDPFNKNLLDHFKKVKGARIERMEKIISNLKNLGFVISIDDCLGQVTEGVVGRLHIVKAIDLHEENEKITKELTAQMGEKSKTDPNTKKHYDEMIKRGPEQYPFYLYLGDDAFVKNIYVPYLYYPDMESAVGLIRGAGGIAILAHWATIIKELGKDFIEKLMKERGIDGLELTAPAYSHLTDEPDLPLEIIKETNCMASIGADAHTEDDLRIFADDKKCRARSIGITKTLIGRAGPHLGWSNLI